MNIIGLPRKNRQLRSPYEILSGHETARKTRKDEKHSSRSVCCVFRGFRVISWPHSLLEKDATFSADVGDTVAATEPGKLTAFGTLTLARGFLAFVVFLLGMLCRSADAQDPTVGACTKKEPFETRQAQIDPLIKQLTEASENKKKALAASIAKKHGVADIENLIRYREPAVKFVFIELLKAKNWSVRARALYGLKMTGDETVLKNVFPLLNDSEATVREMAANTLAHIGNADAVKELEKRKEKEKDTYVLASIDAALKVLAAETKPYAEYKGGKSYYETQAGPAGSKRVEYAWGWKGEALFNDYDAKAHDLPSAELFCFPVSSYKNDLFAKYPRNSFAGGGTHAGEDCAWFREGCSFYAVADGVVRMIQGAGGDWGFLIVIEHRLPTGDYITSVYGHAAWDLLVKVGDSVKMGQKIATEGLSCSIENGGYGSHLHFGLGDGPFRRTKKYKKGDAYTITDESGKQQAGKIARFVYAAEACDGQGFPKLTAEIKLASGKSHLVVLEDEPLQDQIAWMQAYVAKCEGWLNPETFLPEHVEAKPKKKK